jgi:hypothetical protein
MKGSSPGSDVKALRSFQQQRSARRQAELCELCAAVLGGHHAHLVEVAARRILCACDACSVLFEEQGAARYRRIPGEAEGLPGLTLDDAEWESLSIPIGLAFFFFSSAAGRMVALYPSPAGATESLLPLHEWQQIAARSPRLQQLQPDVEALLVNRLHRPAVFCIAPIDRCYELTGILRTTWRGISGGDDVWRAVDAFFERLLEQPHSGEAHA